MDGSSVNDGNATVWGKVAVIHTAVIHMNDGMDNSSVIIGAASVPLFEVR